MQFLILLLVAIAPVILYFLVKNRKNRGRVLACAAAELVLAAVIVWYFVPTGLGGDYSGDNLSIAYDEAVVYPDEAQQAELFQLMDGLKIQRRFFNGYSAINGVSAEDYVYISCYDIDGGHIGLHMVIGGDCFTDSGDSILDPEALLEYLQELAPGRE